MEPARGRQGKNIAGGWGVLCLPPLLILDKIYTQKLCHAYLQFLSIRVLAGKSMGTGRMYTGIDWSLGVYRSIFRCECIIREYNVGWHSCSLILGRWFASEMRCSPLETEVSKGVDGALSAQQRGDNHWLARVEGDSRYLISCGRYLLHMPQGRCALLQTTISKQPHNDSAGGELVQEGRTDPDCNHSNSFGIARYEFEQTDRQTQPASRSHQ